MPQRFVRIIRLTLVIALMGSVYAEYNHSKADLDFEETLRLAEQGSLYSQFLLALMYDHGSGVPEDDKQAVYWYSKAAEQGNAAAQYNLGNRYAKGEGVAEDYVMAHMWWNIAAANGHENARKSKDNIVKRMSPSQIAKAQEMARECMAKNYKGC